MIDENKTKNSGIFNQTEKINNIVFVGILFLFAVFMHLSSESGIAAIGSAAELYFCICVSLLLLGSCLYGLFSKNPMKSTFFGFIFSVIFGLLVLIPMILGEMLPTIKSALPYLIALSVMAIFNIFIGWFAASKDITKTKYLIILLLLIIIHPIVLICSLIGGLNYV
jgi:Polysulphide reductase, NrfD.